MSNKRFRRSKSVCLGVILTLCVSFPAMTPAAPGNLEQTPVFVSTSVKPNIFLVLDDSLSMELDAMKSNDANAVHPVVIDAATRTVLFSDSFSTTRPPDRVDRVLEHCAGYNTLAYDHTETYTPWEGVDDNGDAFGNLTLATAREDPYDSDSTVNLNNFIYFPWNDDGDGVYEYTDSNNNGQWDPNERTECLTPGSIIWLALFGSIDSGDCWIAGCRVASSLDAADQVNFANWYSYYRRREHVLKRAVSSVAASSNMRMGMASLHNSGEASTPVIDLGDDALIDNASDPVLIAACGVGITKRDCLLRNLIQIDPNAPNTESTPLRRALDEAGRYFDQTDVPDLGHEFLPADPALPRAPSPILTLANGGQCQQHFAIVVSDGFWNGPWPPADVNGNPVLDNAGQTLTSHGDADSDDNSPWDGGPHIDQQRADACPVPGNPGAFIPTPWIDTLSDIAMHYYETDLSPLADVVPTVAGLDENNAQHLVTFTVAFGVDGTVTDAQAPTTRDEVFAWPVVCPNRPETVDDMRHAAWNGRGAFLSARSPTAVSTALEDALAAIAALTGATASAVGFNTGRLTTDTLAFQSTFDTTNWTGDVLALEVDPDTGTVDAANPVWQAAEWLDAGVPANRVIMTWCGDAACPAQDGVSLTAANWANLDPAMQSDFRRNEAGVLESVAAGEKRLEHLIGDQSCENVAGCVVDVNGDGDVADAGDSMTLRSRDSLLGDIVGSGPLVVGEPALNWPSAGTSLFPTAANTTYAGFKSGAAAARTPVVYAGANDGMLHGFDATDGATGGQELIAYVPAALSSDGVAEGLHYLTETGYTHRFYVDRTPSVSDVYIDPDGAGAAQISWRTVAVGGLGAGGRGLYALDITDPTDFAAANAADIVMWEFTHAELGYTFSQPIIAPTNVLDGNGLARWAAIVGSGYEDTGGDEAHLFIVFLDGGTDGEWTDGSGGTPLDYVMIEATVGAAERNGLSSPAVADLDRNGTADRVYIGDLLGNMWAFDITNADPANWVTPADPLFTATTTDALGNTVPQPITVKPEISKHPTVNDINGGMDDNQPNVMVYFGTGQYLTNADKTTTEVQSFYGIWDKDDFGRTRDNLRQQTFEVGFNDQVVTDHAIEWSGIDDDGDGTVQEYGWYLDLPDVGERVVADAILRGGVVFFNSLVPSQDPCAGGGFGYLYALDLENGGRPDDSPFDTNGDAVVDVNDLVCEGQDCKVAGKLAYDPDFGIPSPPKIIDDFLFAAGTGGDLEKLAIEELPGLDTGRLSWQQLYRD